MREGVKRLSRPGGGMVDTRDLKSLDHCDCAGSSPAPGTEAIGFTGLQSTSVNK